jgi:hypothetical protein
MDRFLIYLAVIAALVMLGARLKAISIQSR